MNSNNSYLQDPVIKTFLSQFAESEKQEAIIKALKVGIATLKSSEKPDEIKDFHLRESLFISNKTLKSQNKTDKKVASLDLDWDKNGINKIDFFDSKIRSQLFLQNRGENKNNSLTCTNKTGVIRLEPNKTRKTIIKKSARISTNPENKLKKLQKKAGRIQRKHSDVIYMTSSSDEI